MRLKNLISTISRVVEAAFVSNRQSSTVDRDLTRYFATHANHLEREEELELCTVRYFVDWPIPGVRSAVTDGLAHFPLEDLRGKPIRSELALTWADCPNLSVSPLFEDAWHRMLKSCRLQLADDWVEFDYKRLGITRPRVTGYVAINGVWFTGERRVIEQKHPISVVELIPLNESQFELLSQDPLRFVDATKNGSIDLALWPHQG